MGLVHGLGVSVLHTTDKFNSLIGYAYWLTVDKDVYFFLLGDHHTLEVLAFPESPSREISSSELKVPCIFCDREFPDTAGKNDAVLHHLLVEHQLVISDVAQVCDMRRCLVRLNLV